MQLPNGMHIPKVLAMLEEHLINMGGLDQEGIFRLAPDEYEGATVKKEINKGTFKGCKDVNCVANLVKVHFIMIRKP